MADAVGVQVADGLEDRLGAVVLAGVDGLAEERLVRDLVGLAVVLGGIALLLPGEVDADDEQALLAAEPGGRARHLEAGHGVDLLLGGLRQGLEEAPEAERELRRKKRIAHSRMPAPKAGSAPDVTSGRRVELGRGPAQARSTARTTAGTSKPGWTCSCGAKRTST